MRRRSDFGEKPSWFVEECNALGLFRTRTPRFSQLFFYDFSEEEVLQKQGQPEDGAKVSRRAATAYLSSRVRLESKSGLSDVWYWCLERGSGNPRRSLEGYGKLTHSHPRLHCDHMELFINRLRWRKGHLGLYVMQGGEFATEDYVPSSIPEERELAIPLLPK